jgi:hypothetical protein
MILMQVQDASEKDPLDKPIQDEIDQIPVFHDAFASRRNPRFRGPKISYDHILKKNILVMYSK